MKLKSSINIFFLMVSFVTYQRILPQSQVPISVYYSKKTDKIIDTTESNKAKSMISKFNEIISEDVKNLIYVLKISGDYSLFQEKKSLKSESGSKATRNFASSYGGTRGIFYINQTDSTYINIREFSGTYFKVKTKPKKWKVHSDEHKYVGKYKCIKATTVDTIINPKGVFTSDVVAWFSPDLPNFYGPAGYFGLPGLILELNNGKISLEIKDIDFDAIREPSFYIEKEKGKFVTEKQYDSIVEKTAKDFFNISKF
ncbi:MAG: GLPGLI family protein [Allomuricauda sp.]